MEERRAPTPANAEAWRLFVALELPSPVRARVAEVGERLAADGWRGRWVRPDAAHLTLKFYGDVRRDQLGTLEHALEQAVACFEPFRLRQSGAGAFPHARRPRVIWLGVDGNLPALSELVASIEQESRRAGFPLEARLFHPHLTVGRLRPEDGERLRDIDAQLSRLAALPSLAVPVERVALIRSELRREGARYTVLRHLPLGKGGEAQ